MKKETKSVNQNLEDKIFLKKESSWLKYSDAQQKDIFAFIEKYKNFMSNCKTERLCIKQIKADLEQKGFISIDSVKDPENETKIYKIIKNKVILALVKGKDDTNVRLVGSHVDSPRLDLKPNPLYEDSELALFQSHYYGGIKKYHWVNTPLELHGTAFTKDGKEIDMHIGQNDDEPKFIIPDLLPHLAQEQMKKAGTKIVEGEDLNILVGHIPINDKDIKEKIKFTVLKYLNENYDFIEEDFQCAEFEFVPAGNPVDIGFDKGLIGAYGQDDKVCAYTSLQALLEVEDPENTAVSFFVDKEEIGSVGDTGAESFVLFNFIKQYIELYGISNSAELMLENAKAISADVTAALNPTFASVNDPKNASFVGRGVSIEKYGGSRGKSGTHDAHAEYMQFMRQLAIKHSIPWQTGELGKVDLGGGGTIAMFLSRYGMDCVDAGPCLLGMHSPCEVASKADIFSAYRLYKAFLMDK